MRCEAQPVMGPTTQAAAIPDGASEFFRCAYKVETSDGMMAAPADIVLGHWDYSCMLFGLSWLRCLFAFRTQTRSDLYSFFVGLLTHGA